MMADRWQGALVVTALHAVAIGGLIAATEPGRQAMASTAPIMVSFLAAEVTAPPPVAKPQPAPRVAKPAPPPKPKPAPLVATQAAEPLPAAPQPVIEPPKAVEVARPEPVKVPEAAVAPAPVALAAPAPAPAPIVPPRFDAAYLENPAPAYPALARRMHEQGKVLLRVFVTERGGAERVELRASSGSARLDQAALETVRHWRFVPARQGADPVSAWVVVPISFSLEG
jgi:protein TonB